MCILVRLWSGMAAGYTSGYKVISPGIAAALLMGFYEVGGLLLRSLFVLCALFPLYLFRMVGAGDIKMAAVMIGGVGIKAGFRIILCGLLIAGIWSFVLMIRRGLVKKRFCYMRFYLYRFLALKNVEPYYLEARDGRNMSFCMAPSLFIGLIAAKIIWHM